MTWFDDEVNSASFRKSLKEATDQRKSISKRIVPLPGGLPESDRLFPRNGSQRKFLWERILQSHSPGFFGISVGDASGPPTIVFTSCLRSRTWACVPPALVSSIIRLDDRFRMADAFNPLNAIAADLGITASSVVRVWKLEMKPRHVDTDGVQLKVVAAEFLDRPAPREVHFGRQLRGRIG